MKGKLPPDLAEALSTAGSQLPEGLSLRWFPDVESTNDVALKLAEAGAQEGAVVLADAQGAGRGRRGRAWFSPPGAGLYMSCVVRGALGSNLPVLTLAAGVAAAQAVTSTTGLPVELKWPNDLVIGRPWRKLGGILCESTGAGVDVDAVVVGIGVNLRPAAYPPAVGALATSIEIELGRRVERGPLAVGVLVRLFDTVRQLRNGDRESILREWRRLARAGLEGAAVRWQERGRERSGRARDIDETGALLVEHDGRTERIIAGEVTWDRRM